MDFWNSYGLALLFHEVGRLKVHETATANILAQGCVSLCILSVFNLLSKRDLKDKINRKYVNSIMMTLSGYFDDLNCETYQTIVKLSNACLEIHSSDESSGEEEEPIMKPESKIREARKKYVNSSKEIIMQLMDMDTFKLIKEVVTGSDFSILECLKD